MKNKSMIIPIVLLAIGFAAVSTTLILNGKVGIGTNQGNYIDGLVFDEASLQPSEGATATLSDTGRTLKFTTQTMTSVGETANVKFKIGNYSQYDAKLGDPAINCYFVTGNLEDDTKANTTTTTNEYMEIITDDVLNSTTIKAGGNLSEESNIIVKQIKSYVGDTTSVKFQCEINTTGSDSETPSIDRPIKMPEGYYLIKDVDGNGETSVGDEIAIGEEHFHVIKNDENILEALAKYNLNVGSNPVPNATYGIQHKDARGYVSGITKHGNVRFSKTNGWTKEADPIDIINIAYRYDTEVDPTKSDKFSALDALYTSNGTVTGYEDYIKGKVPESVKEKISVRLINKGEIEELLEITTPLAPNDSFKTQADTKGYQWLYYTTYWTQTAYSSNTNLMWSVGSGSNVHSGDFYYESGCGVRPVITISK